MENETLVRAAEKMTIHRGLSELKLIDSKISKLITEIVPVGIYIKGKQINNVSALEDFKKAAQSKYDAVNALIERKNKIKSAIVNVNSVTQITVGGKSMTIADAINYKTLIKFKKQLIENMRGKYNATLADLNRRNDTVTANVQKLLENVYGKETTNIDSTKMDGVYKPYMEQNEWHMFDPLKLIERIEQLEQENADFESEVDAVLSEINAITHIEF